MLKKSIMALKRLKSPPRIKSNRQLPMDKIRSSKLKEDIGILLLRGESRENIKAHITGQGYTEKEFESVFSKVKNSLENQASAKLDSFNRDHDNDFREMLKRHKRRRLIKILFAILILAAIFSYIWFL